MLGATKNIKSSDGPESVPVSHREPPGPLQPCSALSPTWEETEPQAHSLPLPAFHSGRPPLLPWKELTSCAGSLSPSLSTVCRDPLTCVARGRHSLGSGSRVMHHGPLSWRPTLSREPQTPQKGSRSPSGLGLWLCLSRCLYGWASSHWRKVAQLAGQVCLSSNRTQEHAGRCVVNPFLLPAGGAFRGGMSCLLVSPEERYSSGADPLPPCDELTVPLPPQQEEGGSSITPTMPYPSSFNDRRTLKQRADPFPGARPLCAPSWLLQPP
jgi:hypothetical protein